MCWLFTFIFYRAKVKQSWVNITTTCGVQADPEFSLVRFFNVRDPSGRQSLKGVALDDHMRESLLIARNTSLLPMLLDPEGEAGALLRLANPRTPWKDVNADDDGAFDKIEQALKGGSSVVVSLDGSERPGVTLARLANLFNENKGRVFAHSRALYTQGCDTSYIIIFSLLEN